MSNEVLELTLPWLRRGDVDAIFWPQDKKRNKVNRTRQMKAVRPSDKPIAMVMMAFLPLTSVLYLDKTLLLLGKASHGDLPAQILPFPPRAFHLYQNATIHNTP